MKTDIEEPVKKSWKLFIILLLLLIILLGTGVLLIIWFLENSKNIDYKNEISRVLVSGIGVLLLILTLIISLINLYGKGKKKSGLTSKDLGKKGYKKHTVTSRRKPLSKRKISK